MLYLMRKIGESIIINDNIEVRVVEIKGRSVKLGFDSPADVTILRKEIHQRIIEENLAAAKSATAGVDMAEAMANIDVEKLPPTEQKKDEPKKDESV